MDSVRHPAVAGMFYPAKREELSETVNHLLDEVEPDAGRPPKALVVPHAGYVYSGPVAARAYAKLIRVRDTIERVVLLGPSHRIPLLGIATSSAGYFETPLGIIPIDRDALAAISALPQVTELDAAHQLEHSLEVQLPFLQTLLSQFTLVPLVVGDAPAEDTAEVIDKLWGGDETLIVISSDLSHYHDYNSARQLDQDTCSAIETMDIQKLHVESACGRNPLMGLLLAAKKRGMQVETLDLRNSGDTAGTKDRVVGYGAWAFH